MDTKKFIVLFSIALVISLSIPHYSLWGFGVDAVKAVDIRDNRLNVGDICHTAGSPNDDWYSAVASQLRCAVKYDKYYAVDCPPLKDGWDTVESTSYATQQQCYAQCKISNYCTEPSLTLKAVYWKNSVETTIQNDGTVGDVGIIKIKSSNVNTKITDNVIFERDWEHFILIIMPDNTEKIKPCFRNNYCESDEIDTSTLAENSVIKYYSYIRISDEARWNYIVQPETGEYSFTIKKTSSPTTTGTPSNGNCKCPSDTSCPVQTTGTHIEEFSTGDCVKVTVDVLNIRSAAGDTQNDIGDTKSGDIGKVLSAKSTVGNFDWYNIQWLEGTSKGQSGWSAQSCKLNGDKYLTKTTCPAGTPTTEENECTDAITNGNYWCSKTADTIKGFLIPNNKCCPKDYTLIKDVGKCPKGSAREAGKDAADAVECETSECTGANYRCVAKQTECNSNEEVVMKSCADTSKPYCCGKKTESTSSGDSSSACRHCITRTDVPDSFYCDCTDSYSNKRSQCNLLIKKSDSYEINYISAKGECAQSCEVIERGQTCPDPPTCSELCTKDMYSAYASSSSSSSSAQNMQFPTGTCYAKGQTPMNINLNIINQGSGASGNTANYRPPKVMTSENECTKKGETCWCTYVNLGSYNTNPTSAPNPSASIPGTGCTASWCNPKEVQNPPKGSPNEYTGTPSGGKVAGTISQQMVVAGTSVTLSGTVSKQCTECWGYNYSCETPKEVGCDTGDYFLWTHSNYKDCPQGYPQIYHEEGKGTDVSIGGILMTVGMLASIIFPGASPALLALFKAAMASGSYLKGKGYVTEKFATTGNVVATNTCETSGGRCTDSYDTSCQPSNGYDFDYGLSCSDGKYCCVKTNTQSQQNTNTASCQSNGGTCVAFGSSCSSSVSGECSQGQFCCKNDNSNFNPETLTFALNMIAQNLPQQEEQECFRVCGKSYETETTFSPVCVGAVVGYKNSTYTCAPGACGAWANKRLNIEIRGPTGNVVLEDHTTTDSVGRYSYTFNAPAGDGQFMAFVIAPTEE